LDWTRTSGRSRRYGCLPAIFSGNQCLGETGQVIPVHGPTYRQRDRTLGHARQLHISARLRDETLPQFLNVTYWLAAQPFQPSDQVGKVVVRPVEHALEALIPSRVLFVAPQLDEMPLADDAQPSRRDPRGTSIGLEPPGLAILPAQ